MALTLGIHFTLLGQTPLQKAQTHSHLPSQTDGERERVNEGMDAGKTPPILKYVTSEPLTHARVTTAPRRVCVFVLLRKGVCRQETIGRSKDEK